ncbi:hypothetical protein BKA18_005424 [Streptomyces auratus]
MASPVAADAAWKRPVGGRTGRTEYRARAWCCGAHQCWRGRQPRWREAARNPRALWRSGAERTLPSRPYERTVSAVMAGPVIPHGDEFGGWPGGDAYVTPPECVPITGFRGCAFCCCTGLSTGLSLAERAHLASNGETDRPCVRRPDADRVQGEVRDRVHGRERSCGRGGMAAGPGVRRGEWLVVGRSIAAWPGARCPGAAGRCVSPAVSRGPGAAACGRKGRARPAERFRRAAVIIGFQTSVGAAEMGSRMRVVGEKRRGVEDPAGTRVNP